MQQRKVNYRTREHTSASQSSRLTRHLASVHHIHTRNTYHTSFHQHAFVDQQNGHLVVEAPAYTLQVPMLLVRHGQTDGNIKRQFQGQIDEADHALNTTGREQVRQLRQRSKSLCRVGSAVAAA